MPLHPQYSAPEQGIPYIDLVGADYEAKCYDNSTGPRILMSPVVSSINEEGRGPIQAPARMAQRLFIAHAPRKEARKRKRVDKPPRARRKILCIDLTLEGNQGEPRCSNCSELLSKEYVSQRHETSGKVRTRPPSQYLF
ncbi:hypothetical protein B0T10DRAFT_467507 [Thelonectria olida]|uniref:Uncharacterized protein n=1 Tax=Thelonectria olida TaxID=1576542 RepID=A0A9P8VNZ3_9HYPO|nr:hypothetical protein B0T10DRAFT_467507 [Thelonectria olida]